MVHSKGPNPGVRGGLTIGWAAKVESGGKIINTPGQKLSINGSLLNMSQNLMFHHLFALFYQEYLKNIISIEIVFNVDYGKKLKTHVNEPNLTTYEKKFMFFGFLNN